MQSKSPIMRWVFLLPKKIWALRKPVERDRWLFGHTGLGMIIFAIFVATIVPYMVAKMCPIFF